MQVRPVYSRDVRFGTRAGLVANVAITCTKLSRKTKNEPANQGVKNALVCRKVAMLQTVETK